MSKITNDIKSLALKTLGIKRGEPPQRCKPCPKPVLIKTEQLLEIESQAESARTMQQFSDDQSVPSISFSQSSPDDPHASTIQSSSVPLECDFAVVDFCTVQDATAIPHNAIHITYTDPDEHHVNTYSPEEASMANRTEVTHVNNSMPEYGLKSSSEQQHNALVSEQRYSDLNIQQLQDLKTYHEKLNKGLQTQHSGSNQKKQKSSPKQGQKYIEKLLGGAEIVPRKGKVQQYSAIMRETGPNSEQIPITVPTVAEFALKTGFQSKFLQNNGPVPERIPATVASTSAFGAPINGLPVKPVNRVVPVDPIIHSPGSSPIHPVGRPPPNPVKMIQKMQSSNEFPHKYMSMKDKTTLIALFKATMSCPQGRQHSNKNPPKHYLVAVFKMGSLFISWDKSQPLLDEFRTKCGNTFDYELFQLDRRRTSHDNFEIKVGTKPVQVPKPGSATQAVSFIEKEEWVFLQASAVTRVDGYFIKEHGGRWVIGTALLDMSAKIELETDHQDLMLMKKRLSTSVAAISSPHIARQNSVTLPQRQISNDSVISNSENQTNSLRIDIPSASMASNTSFNISSPVSSFRSPPIRSVSLSTLPSSTFHPAILSPSLVTSQISPASFIVSSSSAPSNIQPPAYSKAIRTSLNSSFAGDLVAASFIVSPSKIQPPASSKDIQTSSNSSFHGDLVPLYGAYPILNSEQILICTQCPFCHFVFTYTIELLFHFHLSSSCLQAIDGLSSTSPLTKENANKIYLTLTRVIASKVHISKNRMRCTCGHTSETVLLYCLHADKHALKSIGESLCCSNCTGLFLSPFQFYKHKCRVVFQRRHKFNNILSVGDAPPYPRVYSEVAKAILTCPAQDCRKEYSYFTGLLCHMRRHCFQSLAKTGSIQTNGSFIYNDLFTKVNNIKTEPVICEICGEKMSSQVAYCMHRDHHRVGLQLHCKGCNIEFLNPCAFYRHTCGGKSNLPWCVFCKRLEQSVVKVTPSAEIPVIDLDEDDGDGDDTIEYVSPTPEQDNTIHEIDLCSPRSENVELRSPRILSPLEMERPQEMEIKKSEENMKQDHDSSSSSDKSSTTHIVESDDSIPSTSHTGEYSYISTYQSSQNVQSEPPFSSQRVPSNSLNKVITYSATHTDANPIALDDESGLFQPEKISPTAFVPSTSEKEDGIQPGKCFTTLDTSEASTNINKSGRPEHKVGPIRMMKDARKMPTKIDKSGLLSSKRPSTSSEPLEVALLMKVSKSESEKCSSMLETCEPLTTKGSTKQNSGNCSSMMDPLKALKFRFGSDNVHSKKSGKWPKKCSSCDKKFNNKMDLKQHTILDSCKPLKFRFGNTKLCSKISEEWSKKCSSCDKKFTNKKDLKRHSVVHSGAREFKCPHCPQLFQRKDHVIRHKKKCSNAMLYENPCYDPCEPSTNLDSSGTSEHEKPLKIPNHDLFSDSRETSEHEKPSKMSEPEHFSDSSRIYKHEKPSKIQEPEHFSDGNGTSELEKPSKISESEHSSAILDPYEFSTQSEESGSQEPEHFSAKLDTFESTTHAQMGCDTPEPLTHIDKSDKSEPEKCSKILYPQKIDRIGRQESEDSSTLLDSCKSLNQKEGCVTIVSEKNPSDKEKSDKSETGNVSTNLSISNISEKKVTSPSTSQSSPPSSSKKVQCDAEKKSFQIIAFRNETILDDPLEFSNDIDPYEFIDVRPEQPTKLKRKVDNLPQPSIPAQVLKCPRVSRTEIDLLFSDDSDSDSETEDMDLMEDGEEAWFFCQDCHPVTVFALQKGQKKKCRVSPIHDEIKPLHPVIRVDNVNVGLEDIAKDRLHGALVMKRLSDYTKPKPGIKLKITKGSFGRRIKLL